VGTGSNALIPADALDIDGDANSTELVPADLRGHPRLTGGVVDMGAFER